VESDTVHTNWVVESPADLCSNKAVLTKIDPHTKGNSAGYFANAIPQQQQSSALLTRPQNSPGILSEDEL